MRTFEAVLYIYSVLYILLCTKHYPANYVYTIYILYTTCNRGFGYKHNAYNDI